MVNLPSSRISSARHTLQVKVPSADESLPQRDFQDSQNLVVSQMVELRWVVSLVFVKFVLEFV